jgi:phosphatidylglycerophosphate synthase
MEVWFRIGPKSSGKGEGNIPMTDTAIVVCPRRGLSEATLLDLDVAGLGLLTRSLLTAQRAGFERLLVVASADQLPGLQRRVAGEPRLAGRIRWVDAAAELTSLSERSVVLVPSLVLQPDALRAWRQRVDAIEGTTVPVGVDAGPWVVASGLLQACINAARNGLAGLERFRHEVCGQGTPETVQWDGPAPEVVRSAQDVPTVERRMIRSQRSAEDGPIVDRFVNRTLSEPITRRLVRWPITPNQITVISLGTGLFGAWLLAYERTATSLLGLMLFQFSVVLDHVDGEVARLRFQFSRLGKWLDNFSDHVVDLAVIACVAWRAAAGESGTVMLLGMVAAVGVTGSFLVVFWSSLAGQQDTTRQQARRGAAGLTAMANRDGFCLALWATLLLGRPVWLLWTLAVGSNVYWMVWLVVCGIPARAKAGTVRIGGAETQAEALSGTNGRAEKGKSQPSDSVC